MLIYQCDERDIWMRANVRCASDEIRKHESVLSIGVQDKGYGKDERIVYENYPRQNAGGLIVGAA